MGNRGLDSARWIDMPPEAATAKISLADAGDIYTKFGHLFYRDELTIVERYRRLGDTSVIPNSTYFHALILSEQIFRNVRRELRIIGGAFLGQFLETIQTSFEGAIKRIQDAGARTETFARVIVFDDHRPPVLEELMTRYPNALDVAMSRPWPGARHLIVGDDSMARREAKHRVLDSEALAGEIQANVYLCNTAIAGVLSSQFDDSWAGLGDRR